MSISNEAVEAGAEGWQAHYLEWERQRKDPSHPITCTNPYGEV